MEISKLTTEGKIACDRNIKIDSCIKISIKMTSEDSIHTEFVIIIRILIVLSVPMLTHYAHASCDFESHLEMFGIYGIKQDIRI